ncbi:MAG: AbrB/MazE/SpoVT family DNA-binding domain-containing protein [Phycisphaerae bacterium]|nr:AbrB/MazE/SpoVT family DNA-binding domain-containing protein [Phycisphaerae bacterium]
MVAIAKVFKNGASQAVRLPREFRFEADEVCVKRIGAAILLFPRDAAWELMADALGKADPDFMSDRSQPPLAEEREPL